MNTVLTPPEIETVDTPIIFLAGPIQGSEDWQTTAIEIINKNVDGITVASPRADYSNKTFVFERQVDWETAHIKKAAESGVILFWLAAQTDIGPKNEHGFYRAHAQTTRFELAEAKVRHEWRGIKMVIGIEEGFGNARYITQRFAQDCPDVPLLTNLEETCLAAIKLLSS